MHTLCYYHHVSIHNIIKHIYSINENTFKYPAVVVIVYRYSNTKLISPATGFLNIFYSCFLLTQIHLTNVNSYYTIKKHPRYVS